MEMMWEYLASALFISPHILVERNQLNLLNGYCDVHWPERARLQVHGSWPPRCSVDFCCSSQNDCRSPIVSTHYIERSNG